MNNFRELAPIELWSAKVASFLDKKTFAETLAQVAEKEEFTFFGYFVVNGFSRFPTNYHFTRYPRRKYGIASIKKCNEVLSKLFDAVTSKDHQAEASLEELTNQARVILGLLEGYKQENLLHNVGEVKAFLGSCKYQVRPAEIYTKGPNRFYSEAAAVILANPKNLEAIYRLAYQFKQERFTVENFPRHLSNVVETPYTQTPDEE